MCNFELKLIFDECHGWDSWRGMTQQQGFVYLYSHGILCKMPHSLLQYKALYKNFWCELYSLLHKSNNTPKSDTGSVKFKEHKTRTQWWHSTLSFLSIGYDSTTVAIVKGLKQECKNPSYVLKSTLYTVTWSTLHHALKALNIRHQTSWAKPACRLAKKIIFSANMLLSTTDVLYTIYTSIMAQTPFIRLLPHTPICIHLKHLVAALCTFMLKGPLNNRQQHLCTNTNRKVDSTALYATEPDFFYHYTSAQTAKMMQLLQVVSNGLVCMPSPLKNTNLFARAHRFWSWFTPIVHLFS